MQSTVDPVGRIVLPRAPRDALGLLAGAKVDISRYGETVLALIDTARR